MSPVRRSVLALDAYVPGEQPPPGRFVKLNTNENPYPPSPRVAEALAAFSADRLRLYPDPAGSALRARIAELHGVPREAVFAGNGSDEVLALCSRAFVERDGAIGYFEPSYSLYPVLADIREVARKPVALERDYAWRMPADFSCALFFLARPNAPTGIAYAHETVHAFCRSFAGVVVIDEAYADFAARDCMDLARETDNVIVARTLSKSYSLAGLRVGYAVGHPRLIAALDKLKDSYNLDALSQALALAALSDQAHMRANAARIRATRGRLAEALAALGYTVYPAEANFVWTRPGRVPARDLFARLRARGILVRHFEGPRTGDCLRITVGADAEIDALLEALREEETGNE